jgi:hypothetical protein
VPDVPAAGCWELVVGVPKVNPGVAVVPPKVEPVDPNGLAGLAAPNMVRVKWRIGRSRSAIQTDGLQGLRQSAIG